MTMYANGSKSGAHIVGEEGRAFTCTPRPRPQRASQLRHHNDNVLLLFQPLMPLQRRTNESRRSVTVCHMFILISFTILFDSFHMSRARARAIMSERSKSKTSLEGTELSLKAGNIDTPQSSLCTSQGSSNSVLIIVLKVQANNDDCVFFHIALNPM